MKLTWFGGTTLRIHIGGRILVTDPQGAPEGIDRAELVSGADRAFALSEKLPLADPLGWQPRRAGALIDEGDVLPEVLVHRMGEMVLIDAVGEPPLLLVAGAAGKTGRWGRDAVVVLAGEAAQSPAVAAEILELLAPRLITAAAPDAAVDAVLAAIGTRLDGTGFSSLEPGLALEV